MSTDALFSVAGKTALVTGGTSGIGKMIAQGLVEQGAKVWIVGRTSSSCNEAARELSNDGRCVALVGDLSSQEGVKAIAKKISEQALQLDILVNNAGLMYDAPLDEFSEQGWDDVLDVNLKAVFFLTQLCLPLLRSSASEKVHASIINIGSVGGLRVGPKENYSYQAAKAGLHHLTLSLAKRLGPENITVNAIAPGFFPSKITQIPEDQLSAVLKMVPRRRMGTFENIVGSVVTLASPAGSFTTGTVIPLDGGMSL